MPIQFPFMKEVSIDELRSPFFQHSSFNMIKSIFILAFASLCLFGSIQSKFSSSDTENWWNTFSTKWVRYDGITKIFKSMESKFPKLVKFYSIGKTAEDREMWVVQLGKQPRPLLAPPMKLVASMHGDETIGRAMLLLLAVDLVEKYQSNDARAVHLLDNTEIHLMPTMNVDGFEHAPEGSCSPDYRKVGRTNAKKADLNRDFPDQFTDSGKSFDELLKGRQPETQNMMKWIKNNYFVLSANLHALTLVASYPYDSLPLDQEKLTNSQGGGIISKSPDHEVFFNLATMYSTAHLTMSKYNNCSKGEFKNGVTNGAEWYNVRGGMQDFNYWKANTFDITFELSCCKFPNASEIMVEWANNKEALWKYVEATHWGVKGQVTDDSTHKPIENAEIHVEGISKVVKTNEQGEYWRLLLPGGKFKIWVTADGYADSEKVEVNIPKGDGRVLQTLHQFKLKKK